MATLRKPVRKRKYNASTFDLPEELLESIFEYLWRPRESIIGTIADFSSVGAVCKKWQRASSRVNKQSLDVVGPLIFVPPSGRKKSRLSRLYDFSSNITQQVLLPRTLDRRFVNSWKEWLVTAEKRNIKCNQQQLVGSGYQIYFYNMFSGAYIQLPESSALRFYRNTSTYYLIKKAIASCTPLDPNCIIMAIPGDTSKLAFCNIGDKKWQNLEYKSRLKKMHYADLIYFKDEFYVVSQYGTLFVCNLKCSKLKAVTCLDFVDEKRESNYLVEISGELFRVVRHSNPNYREGRWFTVYKMDFGILDWQQVNSLGEGNSIFISQSMSMCISTNKYLRVQSDCIYYHGYYKKSCVRGKGIEMFDMKTKLVKYICSPSRSWSSLFWITKV